MRVTFLTQDDPLYILPFFESFFDQHRGDIEVSAIFACRSMGNRKRSKLLLELLRLYGVPGFAKLLGLQAWKRLAAALRLSRLSGKGHSLRDVAEANSIPYHKIGNPNATENFNVIASHNPDVLISVACPFILKRPLLELPGNVAINIHHAPLPRYRGMMPTFWQMYHGEESAGITIHTMVEKIDEGDILYQQPVPIVRGESMHQLIRRSKRAGAQAMLKVLEQYGRGERPVPIAVSPESSYFTFPTAHEMRMFRERGLRAI
jgi:methionyl-tRNA formyltransferase